MLYVADSYNHKIKKIDFSQNESAGEIKTWIGNSEIKNPELLDGSKPLLNEPHGLWTHI